MKQFLFLILCVISFNISSAQTESIQEEIKAFEGEITAITFNNIDKNTQTFSSGVGYNGSTQLQIFAKGNKVLVKNLSLLYCILYDPDNNITTYYCEGLGKGISVDYSELWNVFATFTTKERKFMGVTIPSYSICESPSSIGDIDAFGFKSEFTKLRLENQHAGVDMEFGIIKSISISPALNLTLINGADIDGLPIKYRWTIDLRAGILGQMKGYSGFEVTELNATTIDGSIFEVPENITIEKKEVSDLHGFLMSVGKYLKKNNLFPVQRGEEVTYELDESEWDY